MNTGTDKSDQNYAVWGFSGTLIWGMVIVIAFTVTQLLVLGVYVINQHGDVANDEFQNLMTSLSYNGTVIATSTFATLIVCGCIIFLAVKLKRNSNIKDYLGLRAVSSKSINYWFLLLIALIICSDALTFFLDKPIVPEFMSLAYTSAESPWLFWAALLVAAPLFEELFFRGFLIPGFASSFVGPLGAIVLSSLLWAVIHFQYDIYGVVTVFVFGLVLGYARSATGSVLLSIGMHSFMNFVATVETAISVSSSVLPIRYALEASILIHAIDHL
ncbi:MAG: CPBP family intramembrane metalloprotease [Gammaproteobacteria bacterium]|nr:CPBP family intramembrane metalloprotease [Gammaproteobacteria bacterium]MDH3465071.1 CPBP family intramembrane metalloprotease [Gammaproteobacteria bacterium]